MRRGLPSHGVITEMQLRFVIRKTIGRTRSHGRKLTSPVENSFAEKGEEDERAAAYRRTEGKVILRQSC